MIIGDALFAERDLDNYLRGQKAAVDGHVRKHVQSKELQTSDDMTIVKRLLPDGLVAGLDVDFDNPVKDLKEARVTVRDHFHGNVEINGVRATRSFAFKGDQRLFSLLTNPYSMSLPHGRVVGNRIEIGMEGRPDAETLKREIDRNEQLLREFVAWSTHQVEEHNRQLEGLLTKAVAARRAELDRFSDLKNSI